MKFLSLFLILYTYFLAGCATQTKKEDGIAVGFFIDSITSNTQVANKKFVIQPGQKEVKANDLYFREYGAYVSRALSKLGYVPIAPNEKPDLTILISYGVGEPESTITTTSSSYASARRNVWNPNQVDAYSSTSSRTSTDTTYAKYLIVEATTWSSHGTDEAPIWRTTIKSRGHRTDLRGEMPFLVAGGFSYFAKNTGVEVYNKTEFSKRSPLLRYILGLTQPAQLLAGDITIAGKDCPKNNKDKTLICGAKVKGLEPVSNTIKMTLVLKNKSDLNWKNPKITADCYYNVLGDVHNGAITYKKISVGSDFYIENIQLKTNEQREVLANIKLENIRAPANQGVRCDLLVSEATEMMF